MQSAARSCCRVKESARTSAGEKRMKSGCALVHVTSGERAACYRSPTAARAAQCRSSRKPEWVRGEAPVRGPSRLAVGRRLAGALLNVQPPACVGKDSVVAAEDFRSQVGQAGRHLEQQRALRRHQQPPGSLGLGVWQPRARSPGLATHLLKSSTILSRPSCSGICSNQDTGRAGVERAQGNNVRHGLIASRAPCLRARPRPSLSVAPRHAGTPRPCRAHAAGACAQRAAQCAIHPGKTLVWPRNKCCRGPGAAHAWAAAHQFKPACGRPAALLGARQGGHPPWAPSPAASWPW